MYLTLYAPVPRPIRALSRLRSRRHSSGFLEGPLRPRLRPALAFREQSLQQRDAPRLDLATRRCLLHRAAGLGAVAAIAEAAAARELSQIDEPLHDRSGGKMRESELLHSRRVDDP